MAKFFFSELEKNVLRQLVDKHKSVIDSRRNDYQSIKLKTDTWALIGSEFNCLQPGVFRRDLKQLKKCWQNMKCRSKKKAFERNLKQDFEVTTSQRSVPCPAPCLPYDEKKARINFIQSQIKAEPFDPEYVSCDVADLEVAQQNYDFTITRQQMQPSPVLYGENISNNDLVVTPAQVHNDTDHISVSDVDQHAPDDSLAPSVQCQSEENYGDDDGRRSAVLSPSTLASGSLSPPPGQPGIFPRQHSVKGQVNTPTAKAPASQSVKLEENELKLTLLRNKIKYAEIEHQQTMKLFELQHQILMNQRDNLIRQQTTQETLETIDSNPRSHIFPCRHNLANMFKK